MKTASNNIALATVVVALAIFVGAVRIGKNTEEEAHDPTLVSNGNDICVGIERLGSAAGLVCARRQNRIPAEAVRHLGLPVECAESSKGADIFNGDLVSFSIGDGQCSIEKADWSPGNIRLLCGVGLDANRDTAKDLELLPGVGEVKAEAIVKSRIEDGPFTSREDLLRVRGIGPKTLDRIEPWLEWPDK